MEGLPALPVGDYGDLVQVAVMLGALVIYAITTRKTSSDSSSHAVNEQVDDSVLGRFEGLFDRIGRLEKALDETQVNLAKAMTELEELRAEVRQKEDELQALRTSYSLALSEREREIKSLRTSLENHRRRIKELETKLEATCEEDH